MPHGNSAILPVRGGAFHCKGDGDTAIDHVLLADREITGNHAEQNWIKPRRGKPFNLWIVGIGKSKRKFPLDHIPCRNSFTLVLDKNFLKTE
jgi:hypothetical protein